MLYAAVFCSIPSRWPRWKWLECRPWAHLIVNTSSQTDASRPNAMNASKGRLSQEGASFITVTAKANGEHTSEPRMFTDVISGFLNIYNYDYLWTHLLEKGQILMAYARTLIFVCLPWAKWLTVSFSVCVSVCAPRGSTPVICIGAGVRPERHES